MRRLNRLVPGFLQNIDTWLLEHAPAIWVTRVHYFAFFGTIVGGLLLARSAFIPVDIADLPNIDLHIALVAIPAAITGLLWTIRQCAFIAGKNYGLEPKGVDFVKVLIYTGIFGSFLLISPVSTLILQERIGALVEGEEFREDLLALDDGVVLFNGTAYEQNNIRYHFSNLYYDPEMAYIESEPEELTRLASADASDRYDRFAIVFAKYGGDASSLDKASVLRSYESGESTYLPYPDDEILFGNIYTISNIKARKGPMYQHEIWQAFFFVSFFLGMSIVVLSRVKWNYFVVAVLGTAFFGLASVIADFGIAALIGFNPGGTLYLILSLIVIGFMGVQSLGVFRANKFTWARTIGVIGLNFVFPLLPLYFMGAMEILGVGGFSDNDIWMGLWGGVIIYGLIGVHFFKEALTRLDAIPK